jgi:phage major head subunit gpT-like protein
MSAHALISDRALVGMYYQALEQGNMAWVNDLTFKIDSSQDEEKHVWLGMPPQLREWVGGKQAKQFRDFEYSITNKDFESTIEYHERDLSEDKTGQLQARINQHVERVQAHPAKLLSTLIQNGESTLCYDGQYYFDTDHSEGDSGTQSNKLSKTIADADVPTVSEMEDAILESIEAMYGFKDDQGEPLNESATNFLVMVPTRFWKVALKAARNEIIVDGSASRTNLITNMDGYNITINANARLDWTTKFVTFRTDGNVKPFIDQVREEETYKLLGQGSEHFFDTRHIKSSIEKSGNVGYGLWQGAVQTNFAE